MANRKPSKAAAALIRETALQEAIDALQEWIDHPSRMLLACGEMTLQEKRTVAAVLRQRIARLQELKAAGKQLKLEI